MKTTLTDIKKAAIRLAEDLAEEDEDMKTKKPVRLLPLFCILAVVTCVLSALAIYEFHISGLLAYLALTVFSVLLSIMVYHEIYSHD